MESFINILGGMPDTSDILWVNSRCLVQVGRKKTVRSTSPPPLIQGRLSHDRPLVLQISRLSEGSTGQIFATSSVIYQMKMWSL